MPIKIFDLQLDELKTKWQLIDGVLIEKFRLDDQYILGPPKTWKRGEYLVLYYRKDVHLPLHRVIWMLHHNIQIPHDGDGNLFLIDHFDGNKMNNKTWNLRLATPVENSFNKPKTVLFEEVLYHGKSVRS